jgi:hypothetical protein
LQSSNFAAPAPAPAAATQQTYVESLDLDNLDGLRNVGEYGKHWDEEEQEQVQQCFLSPRVSPSRVSSPRVSVELYLL